MNSSKYIVVDGISFCRDDETGYYLNSTLGIRAHRYIYEREYGPIPPGYHVHHKDEDKSNNDPLNFELLLAEEHGAHHGNIRAADPDWLEWSRNNLRENACPRAAEWHGSAEGTEWHRRHANDSILAKSPQTFQCEHCSAPFDAIDNGRIKFCSNACKAASRRASAVDNVSVNCQSCGNPFERNKYKKSRTCSRACANRLRAVEKRQRM